MSSKHDINIAALASLARLEVGDDELVTLASELPKILEFVEIIGRANESIADRTLPALRNVMRIDGPSHESGVHTHALLDAAPVVSDGYVEVKQVISRKR